MIGSIIRLLPIFLKLGFETLSSIWISLTLSHTKNLGSSKLKKFADDDFKFDENGRKFSKQLEKPVGKGENVSNFSFSHSAFKRLALQTCKNHSLFGGKG